MEIVESDHHVITVLIERELNIAQKIVWNHGTI